MTNPLKKTMVFLGLAEEDLEDHELQPQATQATSTNTKSAHSHGPAEVNRTVTQRAAVTPLRRVTPTKTQGVQQTMNEIFTVHPAEYRDAKVIAESFRDGVPVIMNLSRMGDSDAKRIIDFASGLTMGLHGRIERVTGKVFLLTPEHIEVANDELRSEESGSFFVTPSS